MVVRNWHQLPFVVRQSASCLSMGFCVYEYHCPPKSKQNLWTVGPMHENDMYSCTLRTDNYVSVLMHVYICPYDFMSMSLWFYTYVLMIVYISTDVCIHLHLQVRCGCVVFGTVLLHILNTIPFPLGVCPRQRYLFRFGVDVFFWDMGTPSRSVRPREL